MLKTEKHVAIFKYNLFLQLTMKEQKQKEDDKKALTDHFIGTLPLLLNKVTIFLSKI